MDSSKDLPAEPSILDGLTKSDIHGQAVGHLSQTGGAITLGEQSSDLFGNAWYDHIEVLVIPTSRLDQDFFNLSAGYAGEIMRKSINYNIRLAVIGDVQPYIKRSTAFADFVRETNKGDYLWFLADEEALDMKLAARNQSKS